MPTHWQSQPGPQREAIRKAYIEELFYGGAVGGGKSDYLLGDFAQDVPRIGQHWQGILFRRTYPELSDLIKRSQEIYPEWFPGVIWHESDKEWRWPNGSILRMRYLEHSTDWMRYWGHAYTWIGWDELPSWPDMGAYHKMKARLRSAHPVPYKRIRSTGNPGGPSHGYVKEYFGIDRWPLGGHVIDDPSGMRRLYIRSKLSDNLILLKHDPAYAHRLEGLGSPQLVQAWLEGDWNVVAGAYFPEFRIDSHVIKPFSIPAHWVKFRSCDWGSAAPFSIGWYAVSDGDIANLPRGALVKYREWYGAATPNVGLKLTADEVANGIVSRETEKLKYAVIDPSTAKEDGGPSIQERMNIILEKAKMECFTPADNSRIVGWDQVRARLKGIDDKPMLYFFDTCEHTIRTLPSVQHDESKPEDLDTDSEDHAVDETRYACMSRPWVKTLPRLEPQKTIVVGGQSTVTMDDMWKASKPVRRRI